MTFHAQIPSPLGRILFCSDGSALTGLYFTGQKDCPTIDGLPDLRPDALDPSQGLIDGRPIRKFKAYKNKSESGELFAPPTNSLNRIDKHAIAANELRFMQERTPANVQALFKRTRDELHEYWVGRHRIFNVPVAPRGTEFQNRVWRALLNIPYGEAVSYGDVARAAGLSAKHGRPVGAAVGRNPIAIIIPCHRVLSSAGTLTGYTGGLDRKFALLELEGFALR